MRLLEVADPDVCLLASQYSLIDHKNALNQVFPAARAKNVSFVIGSSLNAGFISGSPRYNYGKESYKIPAAFIEKRRKLLDVAANHGVDLRTAALQFSAAPDVASAPGGGLQKRTANPCGLHFHADEDPRRVLGRSQSAESDRAKRTSVVGGACKRELSVYLRKAHR